MSNIPSIKVFTPKGEYEGCVKHWESAAALVALLGEGSQIRWGHATKYTLWTEGKDGSAYESYDRCANTCVERLSEIQQKSYNARPITPGA